MSAAHFEGLGSPIIGGAATKPPVGNAVAVQISAVFVASFALFPTPGRPTLALGAIFGLVLIPSVARTSTQRTRSAFSCAILIVGAAATASLAIGGAIPPQRGLLLVANLLLSTVALMWAARHLAGHTLIPLACAAPALWDLSERTLNGNPWKYALSLWVCMGVLGVASRWGRLASYAFALLLATVSALFETRNIIGFLVLAVGVDVAARLRMSKSARITVAGLVSVVSLCMLYIAAGRGYLGDEIRATTKMQGFEGPSRLLFAARPEAAGNLAIVSRGWKDLTPNGTLSSIDVGYLQQSFSSVYRDSGSSYFQSSILGANELHSVAADFWLLMGAIGVVFVAFIAWTAIRQALEVLDSGSAFSVIAAFVGCRIVFDCLFSPVSDMRIWPLFFAVLFAAPMWTRKVKGKSG